MSRFDCPWNLLDLDMGSSGMLSDRRSKSQVGHRFFTIGPSMITAAARFVQSADSLASPPLAATHNKEASMPISCFEHLVNEDDIRDHTPKIRLFKDQAKALFKDSISGSKVRNTRTRVQFP